mgnify:FL=1
MFKKIIVFEGVDGSGKTYHLNLASKYLKKKKISFIKIREPGGTKNSEYIRKLILSNKSKMEKKTDLLLYLAARCETFNKVIIPNRKKIILIDRFVDSTYAYQHYGFGLSLNIIKKINNFILGNVKPDFTFLHILPKKNLKKKISGKKNKYDKFKKNFYLKVQKGFIRLSKNNKRKYLLINSNNKKKVNQYIIRDKIDKLVKIK